jgi:hypothetical protein
MIGAVDPAGLGADPSLKLKRVWREEMRLVRNVLAVGLSVSMLSLPAMAAVTIDGVRYNLPDQVATNLDGVRALIATADSVGMLRRSIARANELTLWEITSRFEFTGKGLFNGEQVDRVTVGLDYNLPAIRVDLQKGNQRTITVARGNMVWEETSPGVYTGPARTDAAAAKDRLMLIWLLPTAVTVAGTKAWDKVQLVNKAGDYTVPLATGEVLTVDVDGFSRPRTISATIGGKRHVVTLAGYTNDKQDHRVFFPDRIQHAIDGRVVTDLTLAEHWVEPYLIFPAPGEYPPAPAPSR